MRKWLRKIKRRRAGIYLVRTRKHKRPRQRENGYVGRSNDWVIRRRQHLGQDKRHPAKPWTDLDPEWHVLRLPWWLSWKWVQAPLELLAIRILLPRYNHTMNLGNPRRVPLSLQRIQRAHRGHSLVADARPVKRQARPGAGVWTFFLLSLTLLAFALWSTR